MSNILTFKGKSELSADSQFLQDCGETLDFRTDDDGRLEFNEPTLTYTEYSAPSLDNDWSNQELADLFRIKRFLTSAGVMCDIHRGLTDEGDPWCVFCDEGGNIFIHFCRIDGLYLLDSPSIEKPLRGADFNALLSDFTNRDVSKTQANSVHESERHVLHFHRGGKVRLHPSALLSALIWTLFLASEELVLATVAKEPDPSQDDTAGTDDSIRTDADIDHANPIVASPNVEGPGDVRQDAFQVSSSQASDKELDTVIKPRDDSLKEVQGQQGIGISTNAYTIGLSTISIACGLMSERIWEDHRKKVLATLEETDFASLLSDGAIPDPTEAGPRQSEGDFLEKLFEAIIPDEFSKDLTILRDGVREALGTTKNNSPDAKDATDSVDNLFAFKNTIDSDAPIFSTSQEDPPGTSHMTPELAKLRDAARAGVDSEKKDGTAANPSGPQILNLVLDNEASDALVNVFSSWQPDFYEALVNNTKVYASLDLATSKDDTASQLIEFVSSTSAETPETPDTLVAVDALSKPTAVNKLQMFDDKAKAFMNELFSRIENIEMLYHDGDLILTDLGAFKTEGSRTYTMSWEFSDGSVVSTVGLRADFEAFDLIT